VFVQNGWKVVGLHNAGSDFMPKLNRSFYAANEGIWIRSIQDCLISELSGLSPPAKTTT
jgi:hypothetical protein